MNCPSSCLGIHLGDYNLFLREDFTYTGIIQGKLAAGGNITLSNFSAGLGLPDSNVANTVVAGGNLTLTNGAVGGAAWYRGRYTAQGVTFSRGTATLGAPPDFVDFADRFAELESLSTHLATRPSQGSTQSNAWSVTMRGTDPCLNVFTLKASDFRGNGDWTITAPASSFVLVNIFGQAPSYGGGAIQLVGISSRRVLFNFVEATTLTAEGFKFQGTVLAPKARATFRYTELDGGLYAQALNLQQAPAHWNPLDEMGGAQAEVCNAADDNCDGQVDEGFECSGAGSRGCTAWCGAEGMQSCDAATCGYGECTSASCCRADADCASGFYCADSRCTAQRENGASCTSAQECSTGLCVDGVCCNSACEGACDACDLEGHLGTCSLVSSSVQCRSAAGACDVAEFCTGSSAACPMDAKKPASAECRGAEGACDVAEHCTGSSNDCPVDGYASSTTQCRGAEGECDVAEYCPGSGASCPANGVQASGVACTADSNACTSDVCDGAGGCGHPLLPAGTACGSGQVCNAAGQCLNGCWIDGAYHAAGASHPGAACQVCNPGASTIAWSLKPATTVCRASAGECDVAEYCTGTSASCPVDGFQGAGTACSSDDNVCTRDVCNGAGSCGHPALPSGTSCGTGYGEWGSCGGFSDFCDTTGTQSRTVTASTCGTGTCGPSSTTLETQACTRGAPDTACAPPSYGAWSACSYSDTCAQTGTQQRTVKRYEYNCATGRCQESTVIETQACTRNTSGVQCRAGGVCDAAESCSNGVCPADAKMPAGAWCDDGNTGTTGDRCDGAGVCTGCGDGVRNGSEVCDDGNIVTETSCPYGQASCTACNATCSAILYLTGEVPGRSCSSKTVTWSQPQAAWQGNPRTQGTYSCSGQVSARGDGSFATVSASSSQRTGSARFLCDDGTWVLQQGSCDGVLVQTGDSRAGQMPTECSSSDPTRQMWINWYVDDLKRCADTAGLTFWVTQFNAKTDCHFREGFYWHGTTRFAYADNCWRFAFQEGASLTGEWPRPPAYSTHVSPAVEADLCGSLAYPWQSIRTTGMNCKFPPN
ncbi:choice-of-anchor A family protein [Stigmatella erecta]|uniref:choice-of-anchor A family protein n=1 Tax=Stigmatella erecta TaxID=83460 RepID=UPI001FE665BA|nr:choice-of-anchor A family protein [Stigmatella erecta]